MHTIHIASTCDLLPRDHHRGSPITDGLLATEFEDSILANIAADVKSEVISKLALVGRCTSSDILTRSMLGLVRSMLGLGRGVSIEYR